MRELLQGIQLPVRGSEARPPAEGEGRQVVGEAEKMGEVVVRAILPAGCPDHLEVVGEPEQAWPDAFGDAVRDAVDQVELAGNLVERAVEPEEADHPVDVHGEHRLV